MEGLNRQEIEYRINNNLFNILFLKNINNNLIINFKISSIKTQIKLNK